MIKKGFLILTAFLCICMCACRNGGDLYVSEQTESSESVPEESYRVLGKTRTIPSVELSAPMSFDCETEFTDPDRITVRFSGDRTVDLQVQSMDYAQSFDQLVGFFQSQKPLQLLVGEITQSVIVVYREGETEICMKLTDDSCLTVKTDDPETAKLFFSHVRVQCEGDVYLPLEQLADCTDRTAPDPADESVGEEDASRPDDSGVRAESEDEQSSAAGESSATEESSESAETIYGPIVSEKEIRYLTSEVFSPNRTVSEIGQDFRCGYARLATELLKRSAGGGSALVSPLSVLTALQMTANGAKGKTLEEMQSVLCGMETQALNDQLFSYYRKLINTEDAYLNDANAVWMSSRTDFHVSADYIHQIENTFDAQLVTAPFPDRETVDAINAWCRTHTDGMIDKVLEYDDVDEGTTMVLLNALCFEALWAEQYLEHQVRESVFHGSKGDRPVQMMYSGESGYISGAYETGFVKTYQGGRYAFVGLLPNEGMTLKDYLEKLTGERFLSLWDSRGGSVDAGLPKFSFDWSGSLVDLLKEMGMRTVFTSGSDLSGIGSFDDGSSLAVSDVIHKTHIEVEESGTKAAAVTAVILPKSASFQPEAAPEVVLDRPFVYAIVDMSVGIPVFIGCMADIAE